MPSKYRIITYQISHITYLISDYHKIRKQYCFIYIYIYTHTHTHTHTCIHTHVHIYIYVLNRFSCVRLFTTLWSVAHQAPLSMGFSRQEYWNGFPHPPPGDLPDPGVEPVSLTLRQTVYQLSYQESYLRRENFCKALKASTSYTFLFCFSANNMFIHHS